MNTESPARSASVTGLAIVGFIALVIVGLWLALWLARSLTGTGGLGAVADYVGSLFAPGPAKLAVVPTASSSTLPFPEASSTPAVATTTTPAATTTPKKQVATGPAPVYYRTVETTYPVPGATKILNPNQSANPATYSGLPDLTVQIAAVGYIDGNGNLVPDSTLSQSDELGAEIIVTNVGANTTGPFDLQVSVPTSIDSNFTYSQAMPALAPNQPMTVDMRLTVGHPRSGANAMTVTVDPDNKVAESNESNNSASVSYTVN